MTILVTSSFIVYEDEVYETLDGSAVFALEGAGVFLNQGLVSSSGVYATAFDTWNGDFLIHNEGVVLATAAEGTAYGLYSPTWGPSVLNDGLWSIVSTGGSAYGLVTWSPGLEVTNNDVWEVRGVAGACGMVIANGATVVNNGLIDVSSYSSVAVAVSIDRFEGYVFTNNGDIIASGGSYSVGVQVAGLDYATQENPNIINHGTITADLAIYGIDGGYSPAQNVIDFVLNTGTINGAIDLGLGADILDNQGTINGDVLMYSGDDVIDTTLGVITGDIFLEDGNDTFHGGLLREVVTGGLGNDTLNGNGGDDDLYGDNAIDTLNGGDGEDWLFGGSANDTLNGDAGNDLLDGGSGADIINGGAGIDIADYSASIAGVTVRLWSGAGLNGYAQGDQLSNIEDLGGSNLNDILIGAASANTLWGGAGTDYLDGLDGDDTLIGEDGADQMIGGGGIDTLSYLNSNAGVTLRLWNQTASGGHAAGDTFTGIENIVGSGYADFLIGASAVNTLRGGAGADYIDGLDGDDHLFGEDGDDSLIGGLGADILDGGAGGDAVVYASSNAAVSIRLWNGAVSGGHAAGDVLSNIEHATGSAFNDILIGSTLANTLRGGDGADYLDGMDGADALWGDAGVDQLRGGAGDDTLVGGAGADTLEGATGIDTASYAASGAAITVRLSTGAGLNGDAQGDKLIDVENLIGSNHADTLIGSTVANVMRGGEGADYLDGLAGDDQLFGDNGADMLVGGLGADSLSGGAGADAFVFNTALGGGNIDAITDFSVIDDVIRVDDAVFAGLAVGALSALAFTVGPAATTAAHRIVYNATTGALSFDADGNGAGAAVQFATLSAGLALTSADFYVI